MKIKERESKFLDTIEEEQSSYSHVDIRERKLCNMESYKEVLRKRSSGKKRLKQSSHYYSFFMQLPGDLKSFSHVNTSMRATQLHKRLLIIDNALDENVLTSLLKKAKNKVIS